ncbi:hypothetical protein H5410_061056 [Solanum commersonii]|uniref:Uncharacterized protein n=1 Tax=Solanum commersonii TaxID=4109 RepID=A0A9J5W6X6_SOLCO|nr:hypothetical protein H5410_061056 [Solanum commersonii]
MQFRNQIWRGHDFGANVGGGGGSGGGEGGGSDGGSCFCIGYGEGHGWGENCGGGGQTGGNGESDDEEIDETTFMALGDSKLKMMTLRDQLFKAFADKKFEYMELNDDKTVTDKQNSCLKKHVEKLEPSNLDLKSEILRMTVTEKGKGKMSETEENLEKELKNAKMIIFLKKKR